MVPLMRDYKAKHIKRNTIHNIQKQHHKKKANILFLFFSLM